jgi:uncharacterized SAM-binding protein YcdF (DUF218 family)
MFVASKVLSFAIEPLYWVLLFLAAGLLVWRYRPRLGKALAWTSLLALLLSGWVFVPNQLLRSLESRYPPLPASADLTQYVGVVVLGGALADSQLWVEHRQVALNDQAERMTAAVALMQKYPHLKVIFSGGIASVSGTGITESRLARMLFDDMGVAPTRVMYEGNSRNTYENGYFSARMPGVDKRKPWLLLTSSFHMPRAMGVFEKLGWNVTPYPVDYRTTSNSSWYDFSMHFGPRQWELALHELIGYYVYKAGNML